MMPMTEQAHIEETELNKRIEILNDATTMKQVKNYQIYKKTVFEDAMKGLYN
jgi:hypothetical protein